MTHSEKKSAHTIFLSLGSNLGDRQEWFHRALRLLAPHVYLEKISSFEVTKPVDYLDQPDFLNAVLQGTTLLDPFELLEYVKGIEKQLGREETVRFGPRNIDIDILYYDDLVIDTPSLTIPHPRIEERDFIQDLLRSIGKDVSVSPLKKENGKS